MTYISQGYVIGWRENLNVQCKTVLGITERDRRPQFYEQRARHSITEVKLYWSWLVLRWATASVQISNNSLPRE